MLKNNSCKWLDGTFVPGIRDDLTKHGAGLAYQVRSLKRTGTIADASTFSICKENPWFGYTDALGLDNGLSSFTVLSRYLRQC